MIYFGINGRLIGVKCPSVQRVDDGERYQFAMTLEGKRKAQVAPGSRRRVWDLALGDVTTPAQVSVLRGIASGAWGNGPFWFVPAEGPDTNVLEPGTASCDPAVLPSTNENGGPLRTADRWFGRSVARADTTAGLLHFGGDGLSGTVPVPESGPVTAAAYVLGDGAAVDVLWRDGAGDVVSTSRSVVTASGSEVVRSWLTVTPPVGAVWASVRAADAVRGAGPSLTWGNRLLPFSDGRGASKVVVDQVSSGLVYTQPGRTYQNLSFTVTEVG